MKVTPGDFGGSLRKTGLCQVAKALVWGSGDLPHDLR